MVSGIAQLRRAAALVGDGGAEPPRPLLAAAVEYVWAASEHRFGWPPEVRDGADAVVSYACRAGTIGDAAERFTNDEAREAAAMIRRLADVAERHETAPTQPR